MEDNLEENPLDICVLCRKSDLDALTTALIESRTLFAGAYDHIFDNMDETLEREYGRFIAPDDDGVLTLTAACNLIQPDDGAPPEMYARFAAVADSLELTILVRPSHAEHLFWDWLEDLWNRDIPAELAVIDPSTGKIFTNTDRVFDSRLHGHLNQFIDFDV